MPPTLNPLDLVTRVNRDVERSVLRARNGVRYVRGSTGRKIGATPKEVVWQRDKAELWHYRNGPVRYGPPVLIVHSLVSRSYILDLRPGNSLIEYLTAAGLDVFLLDWGVPDELDADNDLERYVDFYLPRARRGRAARDAASRRGDAGRLLPGRRPRGALRRGARGRPGAQPDPDGDAARLRRDGRDGRAPARGPAERRRARGRHRQRARPTRSTAASTCRRRPPRSPRRPASSSSVGRVWINCRIRKIPKTSAKPGRITPSRLFTSPSCRTTRYSGTSVTWGGISSVAMIIQKQRSRPGKRFLANA